MTRWFTSGAWSSTKRGPSVSITSPYPTMGLYREWAKGIWRLGTGNTSRFSMCSPGKKSGNGRPMRGRSVTSASFPNGDPPPRMISQNRAISLNLKEIFKKNSTGRSWSAPPTRWWSRFGTSASVNLWSPNFKEVPNSKFYRSSPI